MGPGFTQIIMLGRKDLPEANKRSSLLCHVVSDEEKTFRNRFIVKKLFYLSLINQGNKLECSSMASHTNQGPVL